MVADAARTAGRGVASLGTFELRNVAEPQELFAISLSPARQAGSVDPVCRMWVAHATAADFLRHDDREHWFCSLTCAQQFAAAPEGYTQ
ncbi:hypothetical protein GCM10009606_07410 [Nocardioides aquiterrae]|uniref:YHS domain-containing protein n=1 Tax=Nocardioides aquiterrae TaxID=203799 RepID=A0ABN1UB60_9ACTN